MRIVEAFSGIGSQAKALEKLKRRTGIEYNIANIIEWDLNATYAYDLMHNGEQNLELYKDMTKKELVEELSRYTLSNDTKSPINMNSLRSFKEDFLRRIYAAMVRTNNLVSVTDVNGADLPEEFDLLTYSFPCQDLSTGGAWHGNFSGINRDANNRSGMLWQIERILQERVEENIELPKFLLMENVRNILSKKHKQNFDEWQSYLEHIGYHSQVYTLNSKWFGVPQDRTRTFMVSVFVDDNDVFKEEISNYFEDNNIERNFSENNVELRKISEYLRTDYRKKILLSEARESNPNDTPSRTKIYENNRILNENSKWLEVVKTITTKQDRNPNAGILLFNRREEGKALYRNLTPRECFLFMGFDDKDFDILMENNIISRGNNKVFSKEKLVRFAGNSIVVDVLESIFEQIYFINNNWF